jgi:DNA sulfur modification protein DndB
MSETSFNPSEGHVILGTVLDDSTFLGRVKTAQLVQLAEDPRKTEDPRQLRDNPDLEEARRMRLEVQRLFEGEKKKNVEPYSDYIVGLANGQIGMTPPIVLWGKRRFPQVENGDGTGRVLIPYEEKLVAIDGETQLAARYVAVVKDPKVKSSWVPVVICHGRESDWARQVFHDLNVLGVQPNAALAISMDARDPLTGVAREVEAGIPFFRGRVNKVRRQLRRTDREVVTITALRGACITLADGISGVRYGARPMPIDNARLPRIREVALEWFKMITELLGPAVEDRERTVAGAPPVLAAIGAMGHLLVEIDNPQDRRRKAQELAERLKLVNWTKGKAWEGIAGKYTPKGTFSVGGTKETAYAIYAALDDVTSVGYQQIRSELRVVA